MQLTIRTGPFHPATWALHSVTGQESLSGLFEFHISVTSTSPDVKSASEATLRQGLIGALVGFRMHENDRERSGMIAAIDVMPREDNAPAALVRMVVRPKAFMLTLRKDTRIFQHQYAHEIVSKVLGAANIPHRWLLENRYPKRVYCTQYEETDFAFVARILAEEGIYFYFDHVPSFSADAHDAHEASNPWKTVAAVASVTSAVHGGLGKAIPNNTTKGLMGTVGGVAGIVSDLAGSDDDEEADDPINGSSGTGGPASHDPTEVFVFCDTAHGYSTPSSADDSNAVNLRYGHDLLGESTDSVPVMRGAFSAGTRAVEIRDYDFRRPMALLSKRDNSDDDAGLMTPDEAKLEYYEHHGEYEKPDIEDDQVRIKLEQLRAATALVKGESTCPRMIPGFAVDLSNAPAPFQDGRFIPVKVRHEAYSDSVHATNPGDLAPELAKVVDALGAFQRDVAEDAGKLGEGELRERSRKAFASGGRVRTYQNRFDWVASDVVFRPPMPKRIRHAVNESAVVVGPAGQQIYVDKYGRVKVQFHWDREGRYNEDSSCWIRVMSTWAGAGFGFQFFPRVGMEVVVTFLGGDPDRPVISGSLYNATHPTPEPLPDRGTRSGLRSQSVPGGNGFNELSFEDSQGVERIFIHAQKDLHEIVNDAHTTSVGGAQTTSIGEAQKIAVAEDRVVGVGGSASETVAESRAVHVGGNRVAHVGKGSAEVVHGDSIREVRGVSVTETVSNAIQIVRGDSNLTVHGRNVVRVASGDGRPTSATTHVAGHTYHTATEGMVIRVDAGDGKKLRLECGDTFIELTHDTIKLSAEHIILKASSSVLIDSGTVEATGSDCVKLSRDAASVALTSSGLTVAGTSKVELSSPSAKLCLDGGTATLVGSTTNVKGGSIHLKSGSASDSQTKSPGTSQQNQAQTKHLKLAFVHPHGTCENEALPSTVPYSLTADGFVHEANLADGGLLDVEVPEHTERATVVLFPNRVADLADRYPSPLTYEVQVETTWQGATHLPGARLRLRNLGYAPGTKINADDDEVTTGAIEEFQRDHGIRVTGKLDQDDTGTKLTDAFGDAP